MSPSQFQGTGWKIKPRKGRGKLIVLFIHVSHLEEPNLLILSINSIVMNDAIDVSKPTNRRHLQEYAAKQNWSIGLEFA